jgi:hypothetical protein
MTQFNIAWSPLLPTLALVLLAIGAVLVVALSFWSGRKGTWLRALGLVLILFALADPSLVREDRQPLKDVVAIVLDRSASQTIGDRGAQTDKARAEIEKSLAALGNVETRVVEAGGDAAEADGTRLFSALSGALADVPPERIGGAFLVTDGVVHDIPAQADLLGFKAPLHALITGREGERDRRIELVEAPRFGLVGKDQTIAVRVLDTADRGEPIELVVRRDGAEISRTRARAGTLVRVNVRVDHGGPNVVELEVPALPDELTPLNNKAVVIIEGVRDKLKVLLVSGEPHAGERTWRNLLKSDANVDLVHFTILRPPEKSGLDGTPISELSLIAFPTADLFGRKIREFDLIIFDRYSNQTVLPPVYFENIVTDIGNKHPVTRGLPGADQTPPAWSEWFRQVNAESLRGAAVMSGADDKPLLLLSREEKGRVGLMLSDQIWLWARNYQNGGPYLELLRRLAHWLMKEPELEEEALRATARGREISIERQSLKSEIAPVTVTSPSGNSQIVTLKGAEPGLSRAQVRVSELGLYKLTDGELTALVNVGAENPLEFREVVSTLDKLKPLAEATGGTVRRISSGSGDSISLPRFAAMRESPLYGGSDYVAIRRTGASVVTGIGVAPLAVGFLGLLALLGSVLAGWLWESRKRSEV